MAEPVSIATLQGGAIVEHIDAALAECWGNILDPNTEPTARREVAVKITLSPDSHREIVGVVVQALAKLAAEKPAEARVVLAGTQADAVALEYVPPQLEIHYAPPVEGIPRIGAGKESK